MRTSLVFQAVKNLPAMQETQVLSLGWEDPLENGMATHSSILMFRISVLSFIMLPPPFLLLPDSFFPLV